MELLKIDTKKCKRDGICVEICPVRLFERENKDAIPTHVEGAAEFCIHCGHCVAVCPHGALTLGDITPEKCPPIQPEWRLNLAQTEGFLRTRRSIRKYNNKLVDKNDIKKLIGVASYAPSGHNSQPLQWLVVHEPSAVNKMAGIVIDWARYMLKAQPEFAKPFHMDELVGGWENGKDFICHQAPHLIIAHAPKDNPMAQSATTIALEYLELAAPSFGLGTCWAGYFMVAALWPALQKALALPNGNVCYCAMMLGYPKYKYHRLPPRNPANISFYDSAT